MQLINDAADQENVTKCAWPDRWYRCRVRKDTGTLYWGSGPLAESDASGNLQREFVFFGGKRIARRDVATNAVHYYFSDHLGSADVVTSASGTIEDESDYYPWGGERVVTQQALTDQT